MEQPLPWARPGSADLCLHCWAAYCQTAFRLLHRSGGAIDSRACAEPPAERSPTRTSFRVRAAPETRHSFSFPIPQSLQTAQVFSGCTCVRFVLLRVTFGCMASTD